jgi:hypothetical protein
MYPKKIIGWILIALGLLIIIIGLYYSYTIFIGKSSVPEVFKFSDEVSSEIKSQQDSDADKNNLTQDELQREMEKIVSSQVKDIIPQELIYKILNLISWSIFAAILFWGGGKISLIGVGMLKE